MITDVYIVYNDDIELGDAIEASPNFHFIDERTLKGKKNGFALKGHWGARLSPFVLCCEGETPVKAFYSETGENVIKSLLEYLNNN